MKPEIHSQDQQVTLNGLQFHYREWGSASMPPLLILHGVTGHAWEFDELASALADQNHVLVPNQRGHGSSAWGQAYSPEIMADDLAAFIDALKLERVSVAGHSMGGVNGWFLAARHPESVDRLAVIDVDPDTITTAELAEGLATALSTFARAQYADPEEAVKAYLADYTGTHQQALRTFVINNLRQAPDGRWGWRFDAQGLANWIEHACTNEERHWSALHRLTCPTLLIRAGDSPFTTPSSAQRMASEIPGCRLVEIPGAGHDIHIDQHQALLTQLRLFLTGEDSGNIPISSRIQR